MSREAMPLNPPPEDQSLASGQEGTARLTSTRASVQTVLVRHSGCHDDHPSGPCCRVLLQSAGLMRQVVRRRGACRADGQQCSCWLPSSPEQQATICQHTTRWMLAASGDQATWRVQSVVLVVSCCPGVSGRLFRCCFQWLCPLQQAQCQAQIAIHPGANRHGAARIVEALTSIPIENLCIGLVAVAGQAGRYAVLGDTQSAAGAG